MRNLLVILFLVFILIAVFRNAFLSFFAQDDFILINHFSGNNFAQNLVNVFRPPEVTHWRPFHNLYFLISGTVFGKNYFGYHLVTALFQVMSGFFIYQVSLKISKNYKAALIASLFYIASPVHFVSLYWISGGATLLGFTFLVSSFYCYLEKRWALATVLFIASLLASEAMVVGALIFLLWEILESKKLKLRVAFWGIGITALFVGLLQLVVFGPAGHADAYKIELSPNTLSAFKYYVLRIWGFVEGAGMTLESIVLALALGVIFYFLIGGFLKSTHRRIYIFFAAVGLIGLFPFILIPKHLSGHYMNISLWGAATLAGLALSGTKKAITILLVIVFLLIDVWAVKMTESNNWVTKRAQLAKMYLKQVESNNPSREEILVFGNSPISSSEEAYYSLGGGEGIVFWFRDKNYKTCFVAFEKCETLP